MMSVKVGLCGFTIGAAAYAETFNVVEVQQTFYDPPAERVIERWRVQAPETFEFTMKAWQVITHRGTSRTYRRMKTPMNLEEAGNFRLNDTTRTAWTKTLRAAKLLRASAILFQCPASFKPEPENLENMRRFFGAIERPSMRFMWEPRGAWPDEVIASICGELDLIHAVDPFARPSLTPQLLYWRLHGNGSSYAVYTDEDLAQLRTWLAQETYVMFNNIPRVGDAKRFLALLELR